MNNNGHNLNNKGNSPNSYHLQTESEKLKEHWNKVYLNCSEEKLGWYESDSSPTLNLVSKTSLNKSATILNVGAGSTILIDELLKKGYSNIIATDLSEIALIKLQDRIRNEKVKCIIDDLTNPVALLDIDPVNLWIDRAVLHFFTEQKEQNIYFDLLKNKVKRNGFVLFAEYNLNGATVCSGLPIHRYSKELLAEKLGSNFELVESFEYIYIMPSGSERPYIYTLFRKI